MGLVYMVKGYRYNFKVDVVVDAGLGWEEKVFGSYRRLLFGIFKNELFGEETFEIKGYFR